MRYLWVAPIGVGLMAILVGCAPGRNNLAMDDNNLNPVSKLTGGHNQNNIPYTYVRPESQSKLEPTQTELPNSQTLEAVQAAQNVHDEKIYLVKTTTETSGKRKVKKWVATGAEDAEWVRLIMIWGPSSAQLDYMAPVTEVRSGKQVIMKPVASTAKQKDAKDLEVVISAEDDNLVNFMVTTRLKSTGTNLISQQLQASNQPPISNNAAALVETKSRVSLAPARIRFVLVDQENNAVSASTPYPVLNFLNQKFAKQTEVPAISRETNNGSSVIKVTLPLDAQDPNKKLCLDVDVLQTDAAATQTATDQDEIQVSSQSIPVPITCGNQYFKSASLVGNSNDGMLILVLTPQTDSTGQADLTGILTVDSTPTAAKPGASVTFTPAALDEMVNKNAFIKVDLNKPRTYAISEYLQEDMVDAPEWAQKLIDKYRNWWLNPVGNLQGTRGFFTYAGAEIQKAVPKFENLDIPADFILVSQNESSFLASPTHEIEGGIKQGNDCPIGPFQLMAATAEMRAREAGISNFHFLYNLPAAPRVVGHKKETFCVGGNSLKGRDDRADFAKAGYLAAAYFDYLFRYFETLKAPGQKITDPKLIIAAYNWGEGRITQAVSKAVAKGTDNKQEVKSAAAAKRIHDSDGSFERLLLAARVYPDYWMLRQMHVAIPLETQKYVAKWLAFRQLNQNPQNHPIIFDVQTARK